MNTGPFSRGVLSHMHVPTYAQKYLNQTFDHMFLPFNYLFLIEQDSVYSHVTIIPTAVFENKLV